MEILIFGEETKTATDNRFCRMALRIPKVYILKKIKTETTLILRITKIQLDFLDHAMWKKDRI